MDKFTKSLLSMIMASRDIDIIAGALNLVVAELECVTASSAPVATPVSAPMAPAWVAPAPTPMAPVVGAVSAPVTYEDVAEQEDELGDESPLAPAADKHSAYVAIYGAGNFLLLDEEDEIESGDEWIIKPEETTSRVRAWRTADDIGHKVGEYQRSHYRRAI